jgi:hypothetical protein
VLSPLGACQKGEPPPSAAGLGTIVVQTQAGLGPSVVVETYAGRGACPVGRQTGMDRGWIGHHVSS